MKKNRMIMLIEDNHDIRVKLRKRLEEAGYLVVSASDGAMALECLRNMTPPHFIILDMNMPIMSGDQVLKAVKADARLTSIPVIQISEHGSGIRKEACCMLTDPSDADKLLELIDHCKNIQSRA
jgi:DNA-binding NtrC family response regulator